MYALLTYLLVLTHIPFILHHFFNNIVSTASLGVGLTTLQLWGLYAAYCCGVPTKKHLFYQQCTMYVILFVYCCLDLYLYFTEVPTSHRRLILVSDTHLLGLTQRLIKLFSIECRETKTKALQWPNTTNVNSTMNNENSKHVTGAKRGKTCATKS